MKLIKSKRSAEQDWENPINFLYAVLLILLYSIGHCGVIVLAGTLGARLQTFLNWDQKSHMTTRVRKLCGVILIFVGLYLLWKA